MSAPAIVDAHPPDPTDHPALRALICDACDAGMRVAVMCPGGRSVADARGLRHGDQVPPADRQGKLPPELVADDSATALRWFDHYVEVMGAISPGTPAPGVAVEVGEDTAAHLARRHGVMPGPAAGWVTFWRLPAATSARCRKPSAVPAEPYTPSAAWLAWEQRQAQRQADLRRQEDSARREAERMQLEQWKRQQAERRYEAEKFDLLPSRVGPTRLNPRRVHPSELGRYVAGGGKVCEGYWVIRARGHLTQYFIVTASEYPKKPEYSGRLYARRLDPDKYTGKVRMHDANRSRYKRDDCWVYSESLSHGRWMDEINLYGELMGAEAVAEFGELYGVCLRCTATLTRKDSIARAHGPVCAKHLGLPLTATDLAILGEHGDDDEGWAVG
nr:DUF6011 domain-containing protein [Mycobacterium sp. UM_NZ2]